MAPKKTSTVPQRRNRVRKSQRTKTWGIYVYFAADIRDSKLQAAVSKTLETLALVGSSPMVKITAMVDMPDSRTRYYVFPPRPKASSKITRWSVLPGRFVSNVDSASIEAILDFFEWSHRNCPADNIALIFWGHGYALDDFDPRTQSQIAGVPKDPAAVLGRRARTFPGKRGNELMLLFDATHNSVLNNRDFAQVIRDFTEKFNNRKPIQVLGLDCCNMAMAEILSELQDVTEYAVAAETGLPFQPWLSREILQKFVDTPHETAREFAVSVVGDFIDSMPRSPEMYVELSACNLGKFKDLEAATRKLVDALLPAIDKYENRKAIAQAWYHDVSFELDGLIDLSSFCYTLTKFIGSNGAGSIEKKVIQAAEEVQTVLSGESLKGRGLGNKGGVVDYLAFNNPSRLPDKRIFLSKGVSIWFPPWIQFPGVNYEQINQSKDYLFGGYSRTRFAIATGWDRFLRKLYFLTQV